MLSFCILAADTPIKQLIDLFDVSAKAAGFEYEVCIGDNSRSPFYVQNYKHLADEYVRISDKELFRMGIPWAHNRITAQANSYKIFYIDADEYPVWVHPRLEELYDEFIVPMTLRADYYNLSEIREANEKISKDPSLETVRDIIKDKEVSVQSRLYNCRYTKFEGVCHSIFHVPEDEISEEVGAVLLHNSDARLKNRKKPIINEQYARQLKNPHLAASMKVEEWGKDAKHEYSDWMEFVLNCR